MPRTRSLLALEETQLDQRLADRTSALNDLVLSPFPFSSQRNAIDRLGFGVWNHCYAFDDLASPAVAMWGGEIFSQSSALVLFRQKGMRPGDYSVGGGIAGAFLSGQVPTAFQAATANDFAFLAAIPLVSTDGASTVQAYFQSTNFGGVFVAVRHVTGAPGTHDILINDGVTQLQASVSDATTALVPHVIGAVLERATAKLRVAIKPIGGAAVVSAEINAAALGNITHAGSSYFYLPDSPTVTRSLIAHCMMCTGLGSASGVSANLSTIVDRYGDAVANTPQIVSTFAGRGRSFVALAGHSFEGVDVSAGETLLTRDCTVQALVKLDGLSQSAAAKLAITGGPGLWTGYHRSVETYDGEIVVEMEIGQLGSYGQLGLRRATDTNEGLSGFSHMYYLSQNSANQLAVWEGGVSPFATGADFYKCGDRLRVAREAGTFKYYYQARGSSVWTLQYTGQTDASSMVVSSAMFTGIVIGPEQFKDISITVDGVRKAISWRYMNEAQSVTYNQGTLYSRGKGEIELAERTSAAVEVRPVNAALGLAELGWVWQDADGILRRQVGGTFAVPDGYTLLTATRRWESPTKVVLRHYVGPDLVGEVESVDGSIDGSTAGSTVLGARQTGGDPRTTKALESIIGFGCSFASGHGWLFNDTASPIVQVINPSITAAAVSTPAFRLPGPNRAFGPDFAIEFNSVNDAFDAGNYNDVGAGDDLIICGLIEPLNITGSSDVFDKNYAGGGGAPGYLVALEAGTLGVYVSDGVDVARVEIPALQLNRWLAFIYVMGRSTNTAAIAGGIVGERHAFCSVALSTALVGQLLNGTNLRIGDTGIYTIGAPFRLSSLFYTRSAGAAGSLLASSGGVLNLEVAARAWMDACHTRFVDAFDGEIDELRVCDYEMSREEIEATWLRLQRYQPDGYRQIRDLMPPGIPISDDPSSKVQRDLQTIGGALGFGSSQVENFRANIMPDRSYGDVQDRWQRITEQLPRTALDSLDKRRRRVLAHMGKTNGVSVPGVQESEAEVCEVDESLVDVIAFDNTIVEQWPVIERERWLPFSTTVTEGTGNLISKTGGGAAWNAGASASTRLMGDGRVDITCQLPAANEQRLFGVDDAVTPLHTDLVKWALRFGRTGNTSVDVSEGGAFPFSTTYAINDVFSIRRRGSTIEYLKNGTVIYTSLVQSSLPLWIDTSIFDVAGFVWQIRAFKNYATEVELIFNVAANTAQAMSVIMPYGSRVLKLTGPGNNWAAGLTSAEKFSGDGYVEVVATETTLSRMFGLSAFSDVRAYGSADGFAGIGYAMFLQSTGVINIYELGVDRGAFGGGYATGDVLRIERSGGVVFYKKNGTTIFTSAVASVGDLMIDCSLFTEASTLDGLRLYDGGARRAITWQNVLAVRADSDTLRYTSPANTFSFDNDTQDGVRISMSAEIPQRTPTGSNPFNSLMVFTALDPILLPTNGEAGIFFWDTTGRNLLLFGLRNTGAAHQVGYQRYRGDGIAGDATWQVLATTSLTKHWLRLMPYNGSFAGSSVEQPYSFSWSTTGNQESQLTTQENVIWRRFVGWWGLYMRSTPSGSLGGTIDVRFTESQFRNAVGTRPFYWYGIRDPALPGTPDFVGANSVAKKLKHAFTHAAIITRKSFLCDDSLSVCDSGPLGGI